MEAVRNLPSSPRSQSRRLRGGFTLVELVVVVAIIVLLIGLLVPAVMNVRSTARVAEVRKDISDLEQAITQFKVAFNIEPPSQMTLYASAAAWDLTVASKRHKGIIKQMWPRFDFNNCGGASDPMTGFFYATGNSTPIDLNGAECLVFFLGGMIDSTPSGGGSGAFIGFAKDPAHPFLGMNVTSRDGPFFEFKGARSASGAFLGRLVDLNNNSIPEYLDSMPGQTRPYIYFSGYRNVSAAASDFPSDVPDDQSPNSPPTWKNPDCFMLGAGIGMPHAYYVSFNKTNPTASKPYKQPGFQIISPGADHEYGIGRQFNPENTGTLYRADRDNITNFHPGRLGG